MEQINLAYQDVEYLDPPLEIGLQSGSAPGVGASPEGLSTAEKALRAKAAISLLFAAGKPVCIAFSAGKDSSVMLSLAITAATEFKEIGGKLPPILVTHANTGIETRISFKEFDKVGKFCKMDRSKETAVRHLLVERLFKSHHKAVVLFRSVFHGAVESGAN